MAVTDTDMMTPETGAARNPVKGLRLVSFIWIVAVLAALIAAVLSGSDWRDLAVGGIAALIPAALGFALAPVSDREWARVGILFAWTALAVTATLAIAFLPMAFLFLCAPAAAVLFKREMVIEAMVLSALAAGAVWYASRWGVNTGLEAAPGLSDWAKTAGPAATIVFMVASMFAVSGRSEATSDGMPRASNDTQTPTASDSFEDVSAPVLRVDEDGKILAGTAAAAQLSDLESGKKYNINDVVTLSDDLRMEPADLVAAAIISGANREALGRLKSAQTEAFDKKLSVFPRGDSADIIITDIGEEVSQISRLHSASAQAGKDAESKTLFFAGVSHELRTPLNAIIGFSDMMRSRTFGPLPGKYSEYADLIHDSGQHMLDLIGDVLDISKIEAGKYDLSYDDFDVADVTRSGMKMIRPAADNAEVILDAVIDDSDPIMIRADRRAVRQIILNLLSNAVKFTPKGGRITTTVLQNADRVSISVEDNGSGMSREELAIAGTPYVQGKSGRNSDARGSGLGLSLVKSLTDLHGGTFDIDSKPGRGTTATVTLPIDEIGPED